jgi:hypothetical protein
MKCGEICHHLKWALTNLKWSDSLFLKVKDFFCKQKSPNGFVKNVFLIVKKWFNKIFSFSINYLQFCLNFAELKINFFSSKWMIDRWKHQLMQYSSWRWFFCFQKFMNKPGVANPERSVGFYYKISKPKISKKSKSWIFQMEIFLVN